MTAGTLMGMAAQLVAVGLVGFASGDVLLRRAQVSAPAWSAGAPERALAAIAGGVAFAALAMVANVVTGGAVFGTPAVIPLAAVVLVASRVRALPALHARTLPLVPLAAIALLLVALYVVPPVVAGSGVRSGDPPWHLGWTEQLLGGEAVPLGPAPELGRNAYPWGWHAVLATAVRLVPGSTVLVAHETLHLIVVAGIPLGAACIARRLDRRAGWAGAAAAGLIGGFGWLSPNASFVTTPSEAIGKADLVVTSPNAVYALMPPALPRELSLVLLAALATFLLMEIGTNNRALDLACGVMAGLAGLVNVPLFVSALSWSIVASLAAPRRQRLHKLLALIIPAVAVFALWAGPVVANYVRYGGFVNISKLGTEWPLATALASWGLLLPLAAGGMLVVARQVRAAPPDQKGLTCIAFALATALLLALSLASRTFEWNLGGNATLLHQGRVWPPAHLLGTAFAGVGAWHLYCLLAARRRAAGVTALGALFALGAASPVIASSDMTEILSEGREGFIYASDDVAPGSFVRRAAAHLQPDDVIAVRAAGGDDLAWLLWQFSGARLARYEDPRLEGNDLRIRYAELAHEWDLRIAGNGFAPTAVVRKSVDRTYSRAEVVASGRYAGRDWVLIRRPPTVLRSQG